MSKTETKLSATHTTEAGHLYRVIGKQKYSKLLVWPILETGVEFWDKYTNKWRPSIMRQKDLIEL